MKNDYLVRKTYYSFVVVCILTSLTATVGMLIDNVIVGQYLGQDALGAMGVVGPVSLVFSALGNICSSGGGTRAAQSLGRGDKAAMNRIFTTNILFVLAAGGLLTAAGLLFTPQIAALLGAAGSLKAPTEQYLYGYFLGAIPTILLSAMMSFLRIDGSPKLPLICIAVMTVANIALDLMMVLVFHQGMFGMALATTISYCLAVATAFLHFARKTSTLRFVRPRRFFRELGSTAATGLPTAISRISDTLKVMVLNNLLVIFVSVTAVTALNVRMQANNILGAIGIGIAQAASPTIGMFFGEQDRTAVRDTLKTTLGFGLVINCVLAVLFFGFPGVFPALLGVTEGEILDMSIAAIRFFALTMPLYFINNVLMNFYQCTKRVKLATLICILQSLVYILLMALILIKPLGSTGVWLAFLLGEVLTLLTVMLWIAIRTRRFPLSLSAILMLNEDFGGDPRDRLELSIGNSMDEVMTLSANIWKFTQTRDIDEKTRQMLALAIEEMAGNIVRHSFRPGEKRWLDLTVLDKPDRVIVRLRDNGPNFDPLAYDAASPPPVDPEHMGIHMVRALASDFEYKRAMGLNNLIITFEKDR